MRVLDRLIARSRGDGLGWFWRLYRLRRRTGNRLLRSLCTYLMCRSAHRHGGYVGPGAEFEGKPILPHGLHGVFISRFAVVGARCKIYQNVTIGEVDGKAPVIGPDCLIGAGAVLVAEIRAEEVAARCGTITNELLSRLEARLPILRPLTELDHALIMEASDQQTLG